PHLFADWWAAARGEPAVVGSPAHERHPHACRAYRTALATVPLLGLAFPFRDVQKAYAIVGASFLPILAAVLLVLNGRRDLLGRWRNGPATIAALALALLAFAAAGVVEVAAAFAR